MPSVLIVKMNSKSKNQINPNFGYIIIFMQYSGSFLVKYHGKTKKQTPSQNTLIHSN